MIGAVITPVGIPAAAELPDHREPLLRPGGARLHAPLELVVERREAHVHRDEVLLGERAQHVEIAQDQCALRHDRGRMLELEQQLENAARHLELPLDGLIRIGIRAERDRAHLVARVPRAPRAAARRRSACRRSRFRSRGPAIDRDRSASRARSNRCSRARSRDTD